MNHGMPNWSKILSYFVIVILGSKGHPDWVENYKKYKAMNTETHYRTCNICEASCGIEIQHLNGEIVSIKGDKKDPLSQGHICPKAVALQDIQNDPNRLRKPIKKTANGWEEISWPDALDEVASKVKTLQQKYGNDSVGLYIGNPTAHNHGALLMLAPFLQALDTRSRFSATSCDQLPHMLACLKMFGNFANFPVPDIDRCQYFLCFGANPMASNGSVMTAPNFKNRIKALQKRNGKLVLLDPRKTETAEVADEHHFIKPGSDSLLLLAMINEIFAERWHDLGTIKDYQKNLELLREASNSFTPESVSEYVGIDANTIRRLAQEFSHADAAAAYGRVGISTSVFSGLNAWLIYALNIITGNLDKAGGLMFTLPAIDIVGLAGAAGETGTFDTWRSRVRNLPEFAGEMPVATMADEILTPGEGQIKAMLIHAGNPVLSVPNGKALEKAFDQLEFMVCFDIYLNETTRHADLILPPTGPLEHGHYELGLHTVAVRNTVKYSGPLLPKPEGTLHDWEILAQLSARLESKTAFTQTLAKTKLAIIQYLGDEGMLDWLIKLGPYGKGLPSVHLLSTLLSKSQLTNKLKNKIANGLVAMASRSPLMLQILQATAYGNAAKAGEFAEPITNLDLKAVQARPHGIDLGPLHTMLPQRIFKRDRKIDLAPKLFLKDIERLKASLTNKSNTNFDLQLIGRRHVRCNNSWLHNSSRLVKGKNRCNLMMSSQDAERLQLNDGDQVWLESKVGKIQLPLLVNDDIMPGVVSMPHGWGHDREGAKLDVASQKAGVSMNDITDNQVVDELTGMAIINGVPVNVYAVEEHAKNKNKSDTVAA